MAVEEIEDQWRDKDFVRLVTVLDIILAVILTGFLASRLFVTDIIFHIAATPHSISIVISIAFWLFLFSLNILQAYVAFKLLIQVNEEEPQMHKCLQDARSYFKVSLFLLAIVIVKIFIFLLMDDQPGIILGGILLVAEMFLRVAVLYFIKEFVDDLRAELLLVQNQGSLSHV